MRTLTLLVLGLMAAGPIHSQSPAGGPLSGVWKLNQELSDRVEDKLREALRPGAFYGLAGRGRRPGGPPVRREQPTDDRELATMISPVLQLTIRQDAGTIEISDAGGQMQRFMTDGSKVKETLLSGGELESSARWKEGRLTIERKHGKTGTLREVYFIDPADGKLILDASLRSNRLLRTLEFRRVYDPAPGS